MAIKRTDGAGEPFPEPPLPADEATFTFGNSPKMRRTACKHGLTECQRCGTSGLRDKLHTTVGGRGVVSRLLGKRK